MRIKKYGGIGVRIKSGLLKVLRIEAMNHETHIKFTVHGSGY
jgi:hypothetical protein